MYLVNEMTEVYFWAAITHEAVDRHTESDGAKTIKLAYDYNPSL